ncbi:MAG: fibrobacter succinogenes major paralogous domain-containing protein [Bacteroidales bacterium]|nr:fibrobacter succinogenes major paralogous domain-containing protein [Bacteroidales bacterium]
MKKLQLCVGGLLLTAIFVLGLFMNQLSAQTPTEVSFTTSNFTTWDSDGQDYTWQVPAGVNEITIIAIGGGGGGGAACQTSGWHPTTGYPGGGGGAWVKSTIAVTPGETLNIHAGSKGSGDCSKSVTNPGWGGNSWVKRGSTTLIKAAGASDVADGASTTAHGTGGQAANCIAPTGSEIHSGGNGGNGSSGSWCGAGGGGAAGGGNGGNGANGSIGNYHPGAGGTTSLAHAGKGAEGAVSLPGGRNGKNGSDYGGGGSGCATGASFAGGGLYALNGGDGAPGAVFITYTASNCNNLTPGTISASTWACSASPADTSVVLNNVTAATSEVTGTYIWQKNGSTINGANNATYTATTSGTYRRGYQVTGCSTVYTDAVTVTRPSDVNPGTLTDNENKTVKNVCKNSNVSVNLIASRTSDITWQQSTDRVNWTDVTSVTPFTVNNITQDVYVRFVYNYTTTCGVPSNNIYTIHAYNRPVVNSLTAPTNLCPNQSSYSIVSAVTPGDAIITTYNWTGAAGSENGTIVPSANDCGNTYNYSLTVTDNNGCTSDPKSGSFTVKDDEDPTVGTITAAPAAVDPSTCNYLVPDLSEAVKAASGTGDNCTSNDDLTVVQVPEANTPITATETTVNYWVVDKCGHESEHKQLTLTRPDITTSDAANITIAPTKVNVTLYFGACDTAYTFPEPTVTIDIPEYSGALELTHTALPTRLEPGTYNITWTISDPCGNSVQRPQTITVVYPDCPSATIDGYTYQSVRIGCECWTTENLRNTKYSNGNSIAVANIYNSTEYPNETENLTKFGRLYSWYSAMNVPEDNNSAEPTMTNSPVGPYVQGACPEGWAIPTEADYLTMRSIAGSLPNVKSPDVNTWLPGHAGNNPGSGFDAKGAGYYDGSTSQYLNLLGQTDFWTSTTTSDVTKGVCSEITHVCPEMLIKEYDKGLGFSIRCIKRDVLESSVSSCGTMYDANGNAYETVLIGAQCWTKTNLRVAPAGATNESTSGNLSETEAYYYVNPSVDASVYGYYYNWPAAMLACPTGWRLPTTEEWIIMEQSQTTMDVSGTEVGWYGDFAGKLVGGNDWQSSTEPNSPGDYDYAARNDSGFSAVPAGYWLENHATGLGERTDFWTSSTEGASNRWVHFLSKNNSGVSRYHDNGRFGNSVRCLKD